MTRFVVGDDRSQSTLFPERLEDYLSEDNPVLDRMPSNEGDPAMFAPFDPDPECPFCSGEGFRRNYGQVGRCDCTELERTPSFDAASDGRWVSKTCGRRTICAKRWTL